MGGGGVAVPRGPVGGGVGLMAGGGPAVAGGPYGGLPAGWYVCGVMAFIGGGATDPTEKEDVPTIFNDQEISPVGCVWVG